MSASSEDDATVNNDDLDAPERVSLASRNHSPALFTVRVFYKVVSHESSNGWPWMTFFKLTTTLQHIDGTEATAGDELAAIDAGQHFLLPVETLRAHQLLRKHGYTLYADADDMTEPTQYADVNHNTTTILVRPLRGHLEANVLLMWTPEEEN